MDLQESTGCILRTRVFIGLVLARLQTPRLICCSMIELLLLGDNDYINMHTIDMSSCCVITNCYLDLVPIISGVCYHIITTIYGV